jgi:hypothetical protein
MRCDLGIAEPLVPLDHGNSAGEYVEDQARRSELRRVCLGAFHQPSTDSASAVFVADVQAGNLRVGTEGSRVGCEASVRPVQLRRCSRVQFYAVAAQIIPVLFLALVVERRFFEPVDEAVDPLNDVLVVLMFLAAEIFALWALAGGKPGRATLALVSTPIAIAGLGLVAPICGPRFARLRAEAGSGRLPATFDRALYRLVAVVLYGLPLGFVTTLWVKAFV